MLRATKRRGSTFGSFASFVSIVSFVSFVSAQQRPVFRAGTHLVRVDAYPAGKDGRIVAGLTQDDFAIFEDGKPQTIETADYVTFDTWTPEAERRDPPTKEAGFELAADASYRVFGIVVDREAFDLVGWNVMHQPLADFLERNLGPHDLFGLVHTKNEWQDFVLAQRATAVVAELGKREWWTTKNDYDDQEWALVQCGLESLIQRSRADRTYTLLEGLVHLFGAIREERKSLIYVADGLPDGGPVSAAMAQGGAGPAPPKIGVAGGRLGPVPRGDAIGGPPPDYCNEQRMTLTAIDFGERFRDLLQQARQANVAFYPISPKGLQGIEFTERGGADLAGYRAAQRKLDMLKSLAGETGGRAIVNTNNLRAGLTRIADDMQAFYVLGYYTTNTKWDGGLRSIKVQLKKNRETIRARREYRAPTAEEMAAMSRAASAPAAPVDARAPAAVPAIVGDAIAYRVAPRLAPERVSSMQFDRTDRLRVEWPVLVTLDRRDVRLLDVTGKPLPVDLPLSEDEGAHTLRVELPLSPFARGQYTIELTAGAGSATERRRLTFVMR